MCTLMGKAELQSSFYYPQDREVAGSVPRAAVRTASLAFASPCCWASSGRGAPQSICSLPRHSWSSIFHDYVISYSFRTISKSRIVTLEGHACHDAACVLLSSEEAWLAGGGTGGLRSNLGVEMRSPAWILTTAQPETSSPGSHQGLLPHFRKKQDLSGG